MSGQVDSHVPAADKARKRKVLGLALIGLGIVLQIIFLHDEPWPLVLTALCMTGLAVYAKAKGRTVFWGTIGFFPVFGPLLGLGIIALDDVLCRPSVPKIIRQVWVSALIVGVLLALAIPNYLTFSKRSAQAEPRFLLGRIYAAEKRFYAQQKRYGNFEEIGFKLEDEGSRYTYRIDTSGQAGTLIPGKDGTLTPDNTVVHAGVSADGQSFTATATANLDADPTLDQWHVNDIKENLAMPDVSDTGWGRLSNGGAHQGRKSPQ